MRERGASRQVTAGDPMSGSSPLANFEKMLATGKDGPLLRYSLGNEHLKAGNAAHAIPHLRCAVALDPGYTAAWKLLGKALAAEGRSTEALDAWREGIAVAERRGDKQAQKEMQVFARRIEGAPRTP
jgi:predicted Zn-dependent protease